MRKTVEPEHNRREHNPHTKVSLLYQPWSLLYEAMQNSIDNHMVIELVGEDAFHHITNLGEPFKVAQTLVEA